MSSIILKLGQVESIYDEMHAGRIRVRTDMDGDSEQVPGEKLPYAFPLLPKTLQTIPKVGECVIIINANISSSNSPRFYIGPIISQPQKMEEDLYINGAGHPVQVFKGEGGALFETIDHYDETVGAFPPDDSVSLVGRVSEDIILKDREIDLRCGIRGVAVNKPELQGKVVFNNATPSYIQMKMTTSNFSYINCVANNFNIISPWTNFNGDVVLGDNKDLIPQRCYADMVSQLHQVPYGDVLVDFLKQISFALTNHVHPFAQKPPSDALGIPEVKGLDFSELLSDTLRIS